MEPREVTKQPAPEQQQFRDRISTDVRILNHGVSILESIRCKLYKGQDSEISNSKMTEESTKNVTLKELIDLIEVLSIQICELSSEICDRI